MTTHFDAQIKAYAHALVAFRVQHDLPDQWFASPDHVAIKCADGADYEAELGLWLPKAAEAQYVRMNGRRLASARLLGPLTVGRLGQVEWVEIMEPRPEKAGVDRVGIDHMEFNYADFKSAAEFLGARGVPFEPQQNPGHQWLSVIANGHEFKLTNKPLADVVAAELVAGTAISLRP